MRRQQQPQRQQQRQQQPTPRLVTICHNRFAKFGSEFGMTHAARTCRSWLDRYAPWRKDRRRRMGHEDALPKGRPKEEAIGQGAKGLWLRDDERVGGCSQCKPNSRIDERLLEALKERLAAMLDWYRQRGLRSPRLRSATRLAFRRRFRSGACVRDGHNFASLVRIAHHPRERFERRCAGLCPTCWRGSLTTMQTSSLCLGRPRRQGASSSLTPSRLKCPSFNWTS